jgi:hypothetical protein
MTANDKPNLGFIPSEQIRRLEYRWLSGAGQGVHGWILRLKKAAGTEVSEKLQALGFKY